MEEIEDKQKTFENIEQQDIEGQINTAGANLTDHKQEQEAFTNAIARVSKSKNDLNMQLAKQESLFKSLKNNVELRKKRQQERQLSGEIAKLQAKIGDFDHRTIDAEGQELMRRRQTLNNDINKFSGQEGELKIQISEIKRELQKPENKNAHTEYKTMSYEYLVQKEALADLALYMKGLEEALIQFHKNSMHQINITIRELWRMIYKGNDIDHIEIKTDSMSGTSQRRSYNYRVVQVSNLLLLFI